MPVFTVTADATANTLAATGIAAAGGAEGTVLTTGDRCRVRNVGGALPSPLVGATDYWAVRVSDDVIKLSDSNSHALAGTNIIDLTTTGSGTTTIEFGLPYSLPTVAGPGQMQIRTVHLIAAWNSLVGIYDLLSGQVQSIWSGLTLAVPLTVPLRTIIVPLSAPVTNTGGVSAQTVTINASSPTFWVGQIPDLLVGETIAVIRLRCKDSATGPTKVQAHLTIGTDGATGAPTANSNVSAGSGSAQYVTMSPALAVAAGNVYIVSANLTTGTQNCDLYHLEVDVTGPVG
jgi:hypothetical protein